jgi:hypothetical protein
MSISYFVDQKYRLQPADLQGRPRRVVIANVTYQGLEDARPVLHFVGQTKRLVLNADQTRQLIALTGSAHFADWVGRPIVLQPPRHDTSAIQIVEPSVSTRAMPPQRTEEQRGWRLAWLVVTLIALASTLFLVLEQSGFLVRLGPLLP